MSEKHADEAQLAELRPLRSQASDPALTPDARLLGQALRQLHGAPDDAPGAVPSWAGLEDQALRIARRRQLRYHLRELWQGSAALRYSLAAAATLAVVLGSAWLLRRATSEIGATLATSQSPGRPKNEPGVGAKATDLRPQVALHTDGAAQSVRLRSGALVELFFGTAEIDQAQDNATAIRLPTGRVAVQVPPLRPGSRLQVRTGDAEVTVHGTHFFVERQDEKDATLVSVKEGLVEVRPLGGNRKAVFLRPGEQVVVPSSTAYLRTLSSQVQGLVEAGRCDDEASQVLGTYLHAMPAGSDVSAGQYLHASCAAAKGEVAAALSGFEQVVAGAHSQLRADNALARIAQLRAAISRSEGTAAWRRYLQRFPQGQHRESAQHYLGERAPREEK